MSFSEEVLVFAPMYISLFWAIVLLLESKKNNRATHFLGYFMIAASIVYLSHAAFFTRHFTAYLLLDSFYVLSSLMVYPLFYWYIKLLTSETLCNQKNLWHLLPALLLSVVTAITYLLMDNPDIYILDNMYRQKGLLVNDTYLWKTQHFFYVVTRVIFFMQVVIYLYLGQRKIRLYNRQVEEFYSNVEGRNIGWANWLLFIFSATAFMSATVNFIGRTFFSEKEGLVLFPALVFSSSLFVIGFLGVRQRHSVLDFQLDETENVKLSNSDEFIGPENELQNPTFTMLRRRLISLFEEKKIFTTPDLKINQVGLLLKTNRTYISNLINDEFGCSFSDYVNRYRVDEVKRMFSSVEFNDFTLEQIAEKAGFTSSAALIRIFKQFEGVTPGIYRKRLVNS
ncbi:MAG: helix-turn-helix transcriptional regulator [Bacteroidales bacterium]|nr:helix-turn-helix transcriptional regulator [Bacteroidales bacterium]